jgi:hypothetical protein
MKPILIPFLASSSFSLSAKENEAKERPPSTWPPASLAKRLPAAVPQTRPNKLGLRQRVPFTRTQSLRAAALNGTGLPWFSVERNKNQEVVRFVGFIGLIGSVGSCSFSLALSNQPNELNQLNQSNRRPNISSGILRYAVCGFRHRTHPELNPTHHARRVEPVFRCRLLSGNEKKPKLRDLGASAVKKTLCSL